MNNDDTRYLAEKQDELPRPTVEADAAEKERLRQNLRKNQGSKSVTFVSILFLLLLLGAGVLGYYWFQAKQEVDSKQLEVAAAQDTVSQLRMQVSKLKSETIAPTMSVAEQQKNVVSAFSDLQSASAGVTAEKKAAETKAIESALKEYYKVSTLPTGWFVMSIHAYNKDSVLGAVVYWPASSTKPAGLIPLTKDDKTAGAKWTVFPQ